MAAKWIYLLIALILSYTNGILYVLQGFLLTRLEVTEKSSSSEVLSEAKFSKVVVLVIDAFRYDFAAYKNFSDEYKIPYYANNMKAIHELLENQPDHSLLLKFVADPPTTTLQRLKGLTTGSLPTFIDVGSNFAGEQFLEDNILSQFNRSGKRAVFAGDDTWTSVFPKSFRRPYPFPSFDVWDLDTVDNGVKKVLPAELKANDWEVLVLHCLGVDHCGHRYGPDHPVMRKKLQEMNELVKYLVDNISNNSLLIVMGDHGMTMSGDHGGESHDEVHAAFFAYSPKLKLRKSKNQNLVESIDQIDLVPTLALLTGSAIPFSSLGASVLRILFPDHLFAGRHLNDNEKNLITLAYQYEARLMNVAQVWRYLNHYKQKASLPADDFSEIKSIHEILQSLKQNVSSQLENCKNLQEFAYKICLDNLTCCKNLQTSFENYVTASSTFLEKIQKMCRSIWSQFSLVPIYSGLIIFTATLISNLIIFLTSENLESKLSIPIIIIFSLIGIANHFLKFVSPILIMGSSISSNLFLVKANVKLNFSQLKLRDLSSLNLVIFFFLIVCFTSNSFVIEEPYVIHFAVQSLLWMNFSCKTWRIFLLKIVFSFSIRSGLPYFRCREEQLPRCVPHNLYRSLSSISPEDFPWRFLLAVFSAFSIQWMLRLLKIPKKSLLIGSGLQILLISHWLFQGLAHKYPNHIPGQLENYLPRILYISSLILIGILIQNLKTKKFEQMKDFKDFSLNLALLLTSVGSLLAGDGLAPPVALLSWNIYFTSELFQLENFNWTHLLFYCCLSIHGFFSTGHHTSLANIPWETAFVGFSHANSPGIFSNILPAVLVSFSTAFSFIVHATAIPAVIPATRANLGIRSRKPTENSLLKSWTFYLLFHALRVFGCMAAAVLHRRHLMVWKIFAPRLLYELLFFGSTCVFITALAAICWKMARK